MAMRVAKNLFIMPITAQTTQKQRKIIIESFKRNEIGALVTCKVLNEGFDVPNADMAIIIGGTQGRREHVQRIGRILRPSEGKVAIVYELICKGTFEIHHSNLRNTN